MIQSKLAAMRAERKGHSGQEEDWVIHPSSSALYVAPKIGNRPVSGRVRTKDSLEVTLISCV